MMRPYRPYGPEGLFILKGMKVTDKLYISLYFKGGIIRHFVVILVKAVP
jgi:hypothetical protein